MLLGDIEAEKLERDRSYEYTVTNDLLNKVNHLTCYLAYYFERDILIASQIRARHQAY